MVMLGSLILVSGDSKEKGLTALAFCFKYWLGELKMLSAFFNILFTSLPYPSTLSLGILTLLNLTIPFNP